MTISEDTLGMELKKALKYMSADWRMQNNFSDYKSNFIYNAETVQECVEKAKINNVDLEYVLHRWYNHKTSTQCERIFVEYGAKKEEDIKNKDIDIYINNEPFDVKLTVYPNKLKQHPYNLRNRVGKNQMIQWMYANQSQQQRKHLKNRLFIVCDGINQYDSLCLKSDFEQIRVKIREYMNSVNTNGFNELIIRDKGIDYRVKSDIIYICREGE